MVEDNQKKTVDVLWEDMPKRKHPLLVLKLKKKKTKFWNGRKWVTVDET